MDLAQRERRTRLGLGKDKLKSSKFSVPLCLPLSSSPSLLHPPLPLLPHPLQSTLDASSRGGLDFQAVPQLALCVIIIHLRVLPPQPLLRRSSASPRPPPAVQSLLPASSGRQRGIRNFLQCAGPSSRCALSWLSFPPARWSGYERLLAARPFPSEGSGRGRAAAAAP